MSVKTFRVDWYPHAAFIDFSTLGAEEIGVLIQIINLNYIKIGPVDNDPKFIGKNCNIGASKCTRIINRLIHNGNLCLTEDGKIFKKRCLLELENVQTRRDNSSKNGQKGAESRWRNEQDQVDGDGTGISDQMASTSTRTRINTKIPPYNPPAANKAEGALNGSAGFNIEYLLNDEGRAAAMVAAPGWDIHFLIRVYNEGVHTGKREAPRDPNKAFPAWCALYCKGKPPP